MSRNNKNIIFSQTTHPDESLLWRYSGGELKGKEKHDVENHLLDCAMCNDVVEGFSYYKTEGSFNASRNRASVLFDEKLASRKKWKTTRLLLAASFILIAATGYLFLDSIDIFNKESQEYISRNESVEEEVFYEPEKPNLNESMDVKQESKELSTDKSDQKEKSPEPKGKEPEKEKVVEELNVVEDAEEEADIDIDSDSDEKTEIAVDMSSFEEEEEETEPISFAVVEEKPSFPGGQEKLLQYLSQNTNYPELAKEKGIEGKVYVSFVISETGKVDDINIARGVDPNLDKEAEKAVSSMPDWKPGKQRGEKVAVSYIVPINFTMDDNYEMSGNANLADLEKGDSASGDLVAAKLGKKQEQDDRSEEESEKSGVFSNSSRSIETTSREPQPATESQKSDFNRAREAVSKDKLNKAVRILNRLEPGERNYWDGMWLKASCLLRLEKYEDALELYRRISDSDNPYQEGAKIKADSLSNQ